MGTRLVPITNGAIKIDVFKAKEGEATEIHIYEAEDTFEYFYVPAKSMVISTGDTKRLYLELKSVFEGEH